jgi:hypothetical protein
VPSRPILSASLPWRVSTHVSFRVLRPYSMREASGGFGSTHEVLWRWKGAVFKGVKVDPAGTPTVRPSPFDQ